MRCLPGRPAHYRLVIAAIATVLALGCATTTKGGINLADLPVAGMHEETIPSLEEARAARRILVLPLADRTAPERIGRMHNAIDDLIRRDLMLLPELSVFPDNVLPIELAVFYEEEYHTVKTAVMAAEQVGATHVIFGEIAARDNQIAIEIDLVDVEAAAVVNSVRVQQAARRIDKEIPRLRRSVLAFFREDPATLAKTVPGFTPPHDVLEDCGYGQDRLGNGDYSKALIDFYAAAKSKKPYAGAYASIAETQLVLGGTDLSERAFGVAIEHDPDFVEAYWRYAVMRIRARGGGAEALALCQRASQRAPLFGPAHLTLGTLWFAEKQYEHADKHFLVAAELLPKSVWPIYNHAHVLRVQGDTAGARAALERAAEIAPDQPRVHSDLALLLKKAGEPRAALRQLQIASSLDPQNPLFLYYIGEILENVGKTKRALAAYNAAAAIPFSHEWLHRKLAEAFVRLQRLPEAERALAAGYADGIRDPEHVLLYASVLLERGQQNRLRRHDYSARAGKLLAPLRDASLSETQRARATALADRAAQMLAR